MEEKQKRKKILILGGKPIGTEEIINYSRSNNIYTIVTDNLPIEKSIGKQLADEYWHMSTADTDILIEKIREANIDGIISGVHEFNINRVMEICESLGLPFYATKEQWEIGTDKSLFKRMCQRYELPVARDFSDNYPDETDKIEFPVIVKPVDGSSGRGISICYNVEELLVAYEVALNESDKGKVIVEEYLKGDEIVVFYTIKNGISKLSAIADYYYNYEQKTTMPLPQVYIYPSKYIDRFLKEQDINVRKFLGGIGVENGTFFLQAFVNESNIYFFEPGYRPGGSSVCTYTSYLNGISYWDMLVNYSLEGNVGNIDINLENPFFSKKCCTLSLVSKGGIVGDITGFEDVKKMASVIKAEKRYDIGDFIKYNSALGQIHLRFFIVEETTEKICETINYIQNVIKVFDNKGEDMLISPFDTTRLNYGIN